FAEQELEGRLDIAELGVGLAAAPIQEDVGVLRVGKWHADLERRFAVEKRLFEAGHIPIDVEAVRRRSREQDRAFEMVVEEEDAAGDVGPGICGGATTAGGGAVGACCAWTRDSAAKQATNTTAAHSAVKQSGRCRVKRKAI